MSEPLRADLPGEAAEQTQAEPLPERPPMRWHGFLVRGMLWLAPALHALQAWQILSGGVYYTPEARAAVYAGLPALRYLDWVLAAALLIGAALQVAARFQLAALRARGAALLKAAYGALAGGAAVYAIGRLCASGLTPLSLPLICQFAAYLGLLLLNANYYRKRRWLLAPAKGEAK